MTDPTRTSAPDANPDAPLTGTHAPEGESSDSALDAGLAAAFAPARTGSFHPTPEPEPDTILAGKYRLSERIGEGGMGSVWVAHQTEPVKRKVAIKLIKPGMDSRQVLIRFEAERQALAVMDHPNIAKVLDGGLHDGRPYFVMELVKGVPITEYCDQRKLTPKERLELFVPVCQAIQHAHQKGVIHRDIKPSNVLVALYDDKPVPKVIDFGVAKATGGALTEHTIETAFGGVVGTPQYMSPEQASLNNLDIDTRSDVYSLGVLLYELLTGSPPFARKELEKKGLLEILRVVREEEPPRPSMKLTTADARASISANRGTEPKVLTRLLRSELDWLVMKALEKDRARRYETANGFAADVQRYLAGEPVQAVPPSAGYRLRKFLKRNKGRVVVSVLLLLALMFGVAGTTWQMAERRRERDVAAARSRQVVESALDQAEVALRVEKLAEVDAALAVAEQVLAQADAPDLRERVAAIKKDRAMITRLNDIFERAWVFSYGHDIDRSHGAALYQTAFLDYGLVIGVTPPEQIIGTIKRSHIHIALFTGLGDWFSLDPKHPALQLVLDQLDPDTFRSAVRSAITAGDDDRIRRLAANVDGATLPPGFAVTLGMHAALELGTRYRIMKQAWVVNPNYYPLARQLGGGGFIGPEDGAASRAVLSNWFRIALSLRPNNAIAHVNLFSALWFGEGGRSDLTECEITLRKAIHLGMDTPEVWTMLGLVLHRKYDLDDAEVAFQKALRLDQEFAPARKGMMLVLYRRKDWDGLALAMEQHCVRVVKDKQTDNWMLDFYMNNLYHAMEMFFPTVMLWHGRPALALRYYTMTRPDEPGKKQARDPKAQPVNNSFEAACAAILAGTGQGSDAPPPAERPALRRKGLEWLSADLKQWDRCATADPTANRTAAHDAMNRWLDESYLKAVRDEAELAKLPPDEQAEWRTLWADVRALRDRTAPAIAPPPREKK